MESKQTKVENIDEHLDVVIVDHIIDHLDFEARHLDFDAILEEG